MDPSPRRASRKLVSLGVFIIAALIAAPVAFAFRQQTQMRNFRVVREGVLYRSGQMTVEGLERVLHDHGIRTVVCLRDGESASDQAEELYCLSQDVLYVRLPPAAWWAAAGPPPVADNVRRFLEVMRDPGNHPVLVHCCAGVHRTGAYCALYRMEHEHWSNPEALAEMRQVGYANLDEEWDILGYLEQYRPAWAPPRAADAPPPPPPPPKHRAKRKKHAPR